MNFAETFAINAERHPDKLAIVLAKAGNRQGSNEITQRTYHQVLQRCDSMALGLESIDIESGMRVSVMIKPGLDFLPLIFALFKLGAIPVLIDPGMGKRNLLKCIKKAQPEAFIGIPVVHVLRLMLPWYFNTIKINIVLGRRPLWCGYQLSDLLKSYPKSIFKAKDKSASDTAAIIYTTGSTGPPKGVIFTHGMFLSQTTLMKEVFGITSDDIDLPGFTLFALFSMAIGMTVILPEMDPTRPANVDPIKICDAIAKHHVTFSFGSPAFWNTVSQYCVHKAITFPSLKRIVMAGAPIAPKLHEFLLGKILEQGANTYTPYGATETLLVSSFSGREILAETVNLTRAGEGYCVGKVLPCNEVKIIKISDESITSLREIEELATGEIGEIIVKGPVVSRNYFNLAEQNKNHKIYETDNIGTGPFWHRIGDVGYLSHDNRLWFCGRRVHRVETGKETMFTVCCEAIFNEHSSVFRSALVGIGEDRYRQTPVIIIEPKKGFFPSSKLSKMKFKHDLLELCRKNPKTSQIKHVLFHKSFPVDIRHNAKIFREKLACWAQKSGISKN